MSTLIKVEKVVVIEGELLLSLYCNQTGKGEQVSVPIATEDESKILEVNSSVQEAGHVN